MGVVGGLGRGSREDEGARCRNWRRIECESLGTMGAVADSSASSYRSLVYVEGDCSMNKFQTKEGTPASALNIVQSERHLQLLIG